MIVMANLCVNWLELISKMANLLHFGMLKYIFAPLEIQFFFFSLKNDEACSLKTK